MSLLQGSEALPAGATSLQVVFPNPLPTTPPVVLCVVENVSADAVKLAISVVVTDSSATGFTASLSQETNSANYKLVWYVSDQATLVAMVNQALNGRRITGLQTGMVVGDDDVLAVVQAYPTPHTRQVRWRTLRQQLVGVDQADVLVEGSAPAPTDEGRQGDRVFDPADPAWVYECVTTGAEGAARWVRYAVADY